MNLKHLSVLLELSAITSFFFGGVYGLALFLIFHYLACLLLAIAIVPLIPERYRKNKEVSIFVLSSAGFLMLMPGYVMMWVLGIYLLRVQKKPSELKLESFSLGELFGSRVVVGERSFGDAPFYSIAGKVSEKSIEKLVAIMTELKNPKLMEYAAKALNLQHDELRLAAFSALFKLEKQLQTKINQLLNKLNEEIPEKDRSTTLFEIGRLYYEFVYMKVVDKELVDITLKKAEDYVKKALEIREDPEFYLLLGRIKLEQRQYEEALYYMEKVHLFGGFHPLRYIPYMAEIYYNLGKYEHTKKVLWQLAEGIEYVVNPSLHYVVCFWGMCDGDSRK